MPAADLAMQRKVPTRLIWMMRSKSAIGKCLISPVLLVAAGGLDGVAGAGAVDEDALLAVRGARLGEAGVDLLVAGDVDLAEHAADFLGQGLAGGFVQVEDRDLDAVLGQAARGGGAEAGGAAGDDGRDVGGEFHGVVLWWLSLARLSWRARAMLRLHIRPERRAHAKETHMAEAYIVAAAAPPAASGGRLSGWHPVDLAAQVIDALLERSERRPGAGGRRDHGLRAAGRRAERLHRPHGGAGLEAAAGRAGRDHRPAMRFVAAGAAFRRPGGDVRHDGLRHRRGRGKHVAHSDGGAAQGLQGSRAGALHEPDDPRALPRARVQPVHGRGDDGREVQAVQGRARPLLAAEPSARHGGHAGRRVHGRDRAGGGARGRGPRRRCDARRRRRHSHGRHARRHRRREAAARRRPHHRGQRQPDLRRRQRRDGRQRDAA